MRSFLKASFFAVGVFALAGFGTAGVPSVATAADITKSCGGLNQKKCATSKATYRGKLKTPKPKGAFFDPRKGGEWWKCPSNRPRRTAYSVTSNKACATKRIIGEKLSKAEFKGKVFKPKPKGAFIDPRKGGEYSSCPSGYIRNLNPVTHNAACTVSPKYVCDSGNIAAGNRCYKKGDCGKSNGRPCLIVERIPSCNKGLAEDFIANKCVKATVAGCLTMVRTINVLDKIGRTTRQAKEVSDKAVGTLIKQVPGMRQAVSAVKHGGGAVTKPFKSKKGKDQLLNDIAVAVKPFESAVPELRRVAARMETTSSSLRKIFTKESFCTRGFQSLSNEFAKLGLKPNIKLKKAGLLHGLLVKKAHATAGEHFFMSYTLSGSIAKGLGVTLDLSFVTDYRGDGAVFIGVGPALVTNVAGGVALGLGFYPKAAAADFAGWGWGVGVSAGPPSKIVSGGADFFFDEKLKEFQGFGFNVGVGLGVSPVDVTFGTGHAWKL